MKTKQILLLILAILCQYSFSQVSPVNVPAIHIQTLTQRSITKAPAILTRNSMYKHVIDTTFRVIYEDKTGSDKEVAFFMNGSLVNESIIRTMNPKFIDKIWVESHDTAIGKKNYRGKIYLVTKENYAPDLLSLAKIKATYSKDKDIPALIMIDDKIIDGDYNKCMVDKNYILRIIIKPFAIPKEGIRYDQIQILTKSEKNIRMVNEIRIRGTEML